MDVLRKTCCCALMFLLLLDSLRFNNAHQCDNFTSGSQVGRFLEPVHRDDSQISFTLTTEPQTTTYKHQLCNENPEEEGGSTSENCQSLRTCVFRKEHQTLLKSLRPEGSAAMISLITSIVTRELSQCVLVLLWDKAYAPTQLVDYLAHLPNPKQVRVLLRELYIVFYDMELQQTFF